MLAHAIRIVDERNLRSNIRTEPSAPTDANISVPCENAMSYTSLSWAMSCVKLCCVSMSQIVQVVSILDVPKMRGSAQEDPCVREKQ